MWEKVCTERQLDNLVMYLIVLDKTGIVRDEAPRPLDKSKHWSQHDCINWIVQNTRKLFHTNGEKGSSDVEIDLVQVSYSVQFLTTNVILLFLTHYFISSLYYY